MEEEFEEEHKELFESVISIAEQLKSLTEYQLSLMMPEIEYIINNEINNDYIIQTKLDRLIDLAPWSKEGLNLFEELCMYYHSINSEEANDYFNFYKEIYDEEYEVPTTQVVHKKTLKD